MRKTQLAILLLALILAACGQPDTGASQPTSGPSASQPTFSAPTAQPTSAPAAPTMSAPPTGEMSAPPTVAPTVLASVGAATDKAVQKARGLLAQRLGVDMKMLELHDAVAQEWPSSALGCPRPDEAYSDIVTPGYLLNFTSGGKSYEVHTDQQATRVLLCENRLPTSLSDAPDDSAPSAPTAAPSQGETTPPSANVPIVAQTRQALADQLGIDVSMVKVVAVEAVEWKDSSLGCPKGGVDYLQVITPGYRITLEVEGKRYEYHTDQGQTRIACDHA